MGAAHAKVAVITLDTPGANYRTVWALHKHYPNVKIYVRAHDVTHGITLEKVRLSLLGRPNWTHLASEVVEGKNIFSWGPCPEVQDYCPGCKTLRCEKSVS